MTSAAYSSHGFYDYYSHSCDESCLTVDVYQTNNLGEAGSENTWRVLKRIGYAGMSDYIMDYYLRSDPDFMQRYNTVIILHSEYVTQRLFDALQGHPHVIYLAPNANYGLVELDKYHMTLVSGHGYNNKSNSFGWKYDNTEKEYDKECKTWKFMPIDNGYQLNCNPELVLQKKTDILKTLRII